MEVSDVPDVSPVDDVPNKLEASDIIDFIIVYGKESSKVQRPADSTIMQLKLEIEKKLSIPVSNQKLLTGGKALKDDTATLKAVGIKKGSKIMLLGSSSAVVEAVVPQASNSADSSKWDAAEPTEHISKQKQHAKVLEKGVPEDAIPGVKEKQIPLSDDITSIPALLNSQGAKVRLTFKEELQQIWIASATTTQKVPLSSISKIEGFPIEGKEEYSIVVLYLGSGESSRYWLYYFPSQHVASLKIRILGISSLL
ncbi:hypothetical protein CEUSTIGMA_g525.t1 [Chlamydomonas eustigma]|uniref:Ubiquitin-like domain-containing protein n=1 Tax=Chlamydomonas eustigma TaxID=1157962 RepID=A0A250WQX6_9CHLO|nr:hypothetical protein CEUSTIGMA_g525.t1 [Chlamydomonas eustigma]|eukprot:GAX73072.1 hypothetical protein CEUSTIGMA_g525.t1 [Chlamydomonas eustigma]